MTSRSKRVRRPTRFEQFLRDNNACAEAQLFVDKRRGNFRRSLKDAVTAGRAGWIRWLAMKFEGIEHSVHLSRCPGCEFESSLTAAKAGRIVRAGARRLRWIR